MYWTSPFPNLGVSVFFFFFFFFNFILFRIDRNSCLLECICEGVRNYLEEKRNSVDADQTPRFAASDLGLHYLSLVLLWDARHIWVNTHVHVSWSFPWHSEERKSRDTFAGMLKLRIRRVRHAHTGGQFWRMCCIWRDSLLFWMKEPSLQPIKLKCYQSLSFSLSQNWPCSQ